MTKSCYEKKMFKTVFSTSYYTPELSGMQGHNSQTVKISSTTVFAV